MASLGALLAAAASAQTVVFPTDIRAKEPFHGTVTGVVTEVPYSLQTLEGVVVSSGKTDRKGRVFLSAGLSAGVYQLISGGKTGRVNVSSAPLRPVDVPQFKPLPTIFRRDAPLVLTGDGLPTMPDSLDVSFVQKGIKDLDILAASPRQVITESPASARINPSPGVLVVHGGDNFKELARQSATCVDLHLKLSRERVPSGDMTSVQIDVEPPEAVSVVHLEIIRGPVQFLAGSHHWLAVLDHGHATIPVLTLAGATGPFEIAWDIPNDAMARPGTEPVPDWEPYDPEHKDLEVKRDPADGKPTGGLIRTRGGKTIVGAEVYVYDKDGKPVKRLTNLKVGDKKYDIEDEPDGKGGWVHKSRDTYEDHGSGWKKTGSETWDAKGGKWVPAKA